MKKNYLFLILLLTTYIGFSQTTVQFVSASGSVLEDAVTYNLELSILNTDALIDTTLDVTLFSGDPTSINNYAIQTVTFNAGETQNQSIILTITDNLLGGLDEVLTFTIANVSGGTAASVGGIATFQLTILDDDAENYTYNGSSWSPSTPTQSSIIDDLTISAGEVTFNTDITANTVTVAPGASLTIDTGATLTTNAPEGLTLQSASNSFSSLILDGSISGNTKYERYSNSNTNGNDLIAPPLTGETWTNFLTNNQSKLLNDGDAITPAYSFGPFDKIANPAQYVNYNALTGVALINGKGYRSATGTGVNLTFTGTVPTAPVMAPIINFGVGYEQWNLIGNPFPSYISLQAFLTQNSSVLSTTETGIYGYNGTDFTIYNQAYADANTEALIAPGQGFHVATTSTVSVDVTFTDAMRSTGSSDDYIAGRTNTTPISYVKLNMNSASKATAAEFYFTANASQGLDKGYDAAMFGSTPAEFSMYSHLVQNNQGLPFTVQSLGDNDLTDVTVALGVHAIQGEQITFSISNSTLPETIKVYLEDNATNTFTLLNTGDYTITPNETLNGTGRFFLRYTDSALNNENNELNGLSIFAQAQTKTIQVRGLLANQTSCTVYDIQGRAIKTATLNTSTTTQAISTQNFSTGVYIVKLANSTQQKTQKVIIK